MALEYHLVTAIKAARRLGPTFAAIESSNLLTSSPRTEAELPIVSLELSRVARSGTRGLPNGIGMLARSPRS